jgi:hypothetical protein
VPWFKVDDRLAHHPKIMQAGNAAMGLWVRAGSWSAAHLTDGFIPADLVPTFGAKRRDAEALVKANLWSAEPDGYRFRDWLDYQPSAHDVKLSQDAESHGGSFGNHKRWHTRRKVTDPECRFCNEEAAS